MNLEKLIKMIAKPVYDLPLALMGFDGFIDTIAHISHGDAKFFRSMTSFGSFLVDRDESNCAIEIHRSVRKIGGNMPICANALSTLGLPVSCVGALGDGSVEPIFSKMHPLCSLYPVAMPGECLALEFTDSKLYLADMSGPAAMTWETVKNNVGLDKLIHIADSSDLIGLFNWGEIPNIQEIWQGFAKHILPVLQKKHRTAVFDLSDCSGRSTESLKAILGVIAAFRPYAQVAVSVNDNELHALSYALGFDNEDPVSQGKGVYQTGAMDILVHHSLNYARLFEGGEVSSIAGIHISNPVLVTGGGDHFNAGLCFGLMAGLDHRECVELGNVVSRLFVSSGNSPLLSTILRELGYRETECKEEGA